MAEYIVGLRKARDCGIQDVECGMWDLDFGFGFGFI